MLQQQQLNHDLFQITKNNPKHNYLPLWRIRNHTYRSPIPMTQSQRQTIQTNSYIDSIRMQKQQQIYQQLKKNEKIKQKKQNFTGPKKFNNYSYRLTQDEQLESNNNNLISEEIANIKNKQTKIKESNKFKDKIISRSDQSEESSLQLEPHIQQQSQDVDDDNEDQNWLKSKGFKNNQKNRLSNKSQEIIQQQSQKNSQDQNNDQSINNKNIHQLSINQKLDQLLLIKTTDYDNLFQKILLPRINPTLQQKKTIDFQKQFQKTQNKLNINNTIAFLPSDGKQIATVVRRNKKQQSHNKVTINKNRSLSQNKQSKLGFMTTLIKKKNASNNNKNKNSLIKHKKLDLSQIQKYLEQYDWLDFMLQSLKGNKIKDAIRGFMQIEYPNNKQQYNPQIKYMQYLQLDLHQQRIIKRFIFLLNVTVLTVAFCQVNDIIKNYLNFLSNLVRYSKQNYLHFLVLNHKGFSGIQKSDSEENGYSEVRKLSSIANAFKGMPQIRIFQKIKNNNQIIWQLVGKVLKQKVQFNEIIKNISKNIFFTKLRHSLNILFTNFAIFLHHENLVQKIPFMGIAPAPYLHKIDNNLYKYTVIVDIFSTIIHQRKSQLLIRPFTRQFFQELSKYYQIVCFTNQVPHKIDGLIDTLQSHVRISQRLYRHHLNYDSRKYTLDLHKVGRNLKNLVFLTGQRQKNDNYLNIKCWRGSKGDRVLQKLLPYMIEVAESGLNWQDVIEDRNMQKLKIQKELRNRRF